MVPAVAAHDPPLLYDVEEDPSEAYPLGWKPKLTKGGGRYSLEGLLNAKAEYEAGKAEVKEARVVLHLEPPPPPSALRALLRSAACVAECPKGSSCHPTRGVALNVSARNRWPTDVWAIMSTK